MNLRINNLSLVPPEPVGGFVNAAGQPVKRRGHWWAYVEDTDAWVFGGNYAELVESFRQHLITNKLPVPADLDGTVQAIICSMTPSNWKRGCVAQDANGFSITITLALVKRWLSTMKAFITSGSLISQQEAEERAQTCLRCRYRTPITGCKGCGQSLGGAVTALLIDRSTPFDADLTACGVCGCALRAMVHLDNATLDAGSAGLDYPENIGTGEVCWRRTRNIPL